MKKMFLIICISLLSFKSNATDLRGMVEHYYNAYQPSPMSGVLVNLYTINAYNQWVYIAYFYTDGYGMYYFTGLMPGTYGLQVAGGQIFPISVYNTPVQDVNPVFI